MIESNIQKAMILAYLNEQLEAGFQAVWLRKNESDLFDLLNAKGLVIFEDNDIYTVNTFNLLQFIEAYEDADN